MSLLLEVLRKAEDARRHSDAPRNTASPLPPAPPPPASATSAFELEPLAPTPGLIRNSNPPAAADVQELPAGPPLNTTHAPPAPPAGPAPAHTARNPQIARPPLTTRPWIWIGSLAAGSAITVATWVWLETRPSPLPGAYAAPPPANTPLPGPAEAAVEAYPVAESFAPSIIDAPVQVSRPRPPKPALRPSPAAPQSVTPPISFQPGRSTASSIHFTLGRAHDAYSGGQLELAQELYEQALAIEPRNSAALDGLGAIALRQGRSNEAARHFQRALEASPGDAVALAGLATLRGSDPQQSETHLKTILASQPESASAHFALGNALARQQRWAEAQQAYFKALSLAPDNPDLAYNLAVSLDRLGQSRPAVDHYRLALRLSDTHPAAFDRQAGETRLRALAGTEPSP